MQRKAGVVLLVMISMVLANVVLAGPTRRPPHPCPPESPLCGVNCCPDDCCPDGSCANSQSDNEHCGPDCEDCTQKQQICVLGKCVDEGCPATAPICGVNCCPDFCCPDGTCANNHTDNAHCGPDCVDCTQDRDYPYCVAGSCVSECPATAPICGVNCCPDYCCPDGTCANSQSDNEHCGIVCENCETQGKECVNGHCVDPTCSVALVPKTGQKHCYSDDGDVIPCAGTGQDGELQKGLAWPLPRFTDNANGTVTDNLTRLIWLKNANCFGRHPFDTALPIVKGLASGSCGLTDHSRMGDWRVPNRLELETLLHMGCRDPALPDTIGTGCSPSGGGGNPFTNVQTGWYYWSSSSLAGWNGDTWIVGMLNGDVDLYSAGINVPRFMWPVRGGQ